MADAQKLLPTDTLRQGYPKINDAIDNANEALTTSQISDAKADEAVATANAAKTKADSVQEQFNQVVIEGDSSVEAAQARVDSNNNIFATLKERLDTKEDSFTAQLATMMTQTEFDSWVATLLDGGPSIFFDTYNQLVTTYPNGAAGVALVRETDPAHLYVWTSGVWKDYGAYQGLEPKNGTISLPKLDVTLNSALGEYIEEDETIISGAFFHKSTGALSNYAGFNSIKKSVSYGDMLAITSKVAGINTALAVFLDSNNNLVSVVGSGTASEVIYTDYELTVPIGVAYVGITSNGSIPIVKKKKVIDIKNKLDTLEQSKPTWDSAVNLANEIKDNMSGYEHTEISIENGFLSKTDGTVNTTYAGYSHVKEEVSPKEVLLVSARVSGGGTALAVFYDTNGNFISSYLPGTVDTTYVDEPVTIPDNAYIVGITGNNGVDIVIKRQSIINVNNIKSDVEELKVKVVEPLDISPIEEDIKKISSPYSYDGAVFVIVDDDATTDFLTNMKPYLDAKGVKATIAAITGRVGTNTYMTKEQLLTLQEEGYEIVSHSKSHANNIFISNSSSVTDAAIETEYRESQEWLKTNGFEGYETFVFPYGGFADRLRYKKLARKYYKHCLNSGDGVYNPSPFDNMWMHRSFINIAQDFTTVVKPVIDTAIANKGLLIFASHSFDEAQFTGEYLTTIIEYLQNQGAPILTFGEAMKIKDNALSIGEYTSNKKFFVGNDGNVIMGTLS